MITTEELTRMVEASPDDHDLRWWLAKTLYSQWDYRSALEHLTLLHTAQPNQLEIVRYLAATFYRLGRYDEAVTVIDEILAISPNEVQLLELLARVYGAAGRRADAVAAWKTVYKLAPSAEVIHTIEGLEDLAQPESDSADASVDQEDFELDTTCPFCGAEIELPEKRCFRCHGMLLQQDDSDSGHIEEVRPTRDFTLLVFALSSAIVVALCLFAYQIT